MKEKEIKKTNSLRYAVGMFGTSIPINMFKTYATIFYVDTLSYITFAQFAMITLAYTALDAIDNPIYGYVSDRTRSRFGRRRPWLMIGTPLLVTCFIMFFNPPGALAQGSAISYIVLMYMLTGTLDSLIATNYGALFPELFKSDKERIKTNAIKQVFQLIAMVVSIALTPMVTEAIGYSKTAMLYGALALIVIWYMAIGTHEDPEIQKTETPKLMETIKAIVINPNFWKYGVTNAIYTGAIVLVQAGVPFYIKYSLNRDDGISSTIVLGTAILSAAALIPIWFKISKKQTPLNVLRLSILIFIVGLVPLFLTSNFIVAVITTVAFGFGMGGILVSMDVISAQIIDEDYRRYKRNREGIYHSMLQILNKASGLLTAAAYLIVDGFFGFKSGDNPGSNPDAASRFLLAAFPICLMVIALVLALLIKFKDSDTQGDESDEQFA